MRVARGSLPVVALLCLAIGAPAQDWPSFRGPGAQDVADGQVLDLVAQAREEVFLECPYVTDPFLRELQRAARRGVRVRIVTPELNNFPLVRQALAQAAERSPLELRLYPGRMTHMKALLVDDRCLVLGSANFDVWSDRSQHEYVLVVSEPETIAEFRRRVVEPDLARSRPCPRVEAVEGSRGVELRLAGLAVLAALGARARGGPSIRLAEPSSPQLASPPLAPLNWSASSANSTLKLVRLP